MIPEAVLRADVCVWADVSYGAVTCGAMTCGAVTARAVLTDVGPYCIARTWADTRAIVGVARWAVCHCLCVGA